MQQAWAPLLFVDEAPPARPDPVAKALRSQRAIRKDRTGRTAEGFPVHSFRTLLATLGTLVKNRVVPRRAEPEAAFDLFTQPTPLQQRAFELLGHPLRGL
jgi:hypothetical protein